MKKTIICILLLLWLSVLGIAFSQASEGLIVFTKSEFTRDGFREQIIKGIYSERIWWTFFQRNICVINPDGTGFKQLTDDNTNYHPQWSPDGKKIAFCSGPPPRVSLHIIDPNGENRTEVMKWQNDIYDFRWSPDGTKIMVYVETNSPRDPEETWIVTIGKENSVERMGSSEWAKGWNHWNSTGATVLNPNRRLIDALPEGIEWPEWSPDNIYIAFLYKGKLALANTTVVGMPEKWHLGEFDPPCNRIIRWSPDGSKFLFLGGGDVSSINVDGSGITNLSMSEATDACWSPTGEYIAYTSTDGRKKNTEIYIMNADGTEHVRITNTNYFHMDVDWK